MSSNYGAECPQCGAVRSTTVSASLEPEGQRIRLRGCENCEHRFTTVEVAVPWSFHKLDSLKHEYRNAKNPPRYTKDSLVVVRKGDTIVLRRIPGARLDLCRKGLHRLAGENVYVNPRTGHRVCRPCRRETDRARHRHMMDKMPESLREERRAYYRQQNEKRRAYRTEWARKKRAALREQQERAA